MYASARSWFLDADADDLPGRWTVAQKGLAAVVLVMLVHNTLGFIANPSFASGDSATVERVLFVDFNGWHALAGYLLALPALLAVRHARWAVAYAGYMAFAIALSGAFILADHGALGLVPFGDGAGRDAIYHFALAAAFGLVAVVGARDLRRRAAARPA